MNDNSERRQKTRFPHEAPVTLENKEIGLLHGIRMYNYSSSGIYFETNFYLQPGMDLYIGIKSSPLSEETDVYECYRAVIKWRKFLEESSFDYGYGLQLIARAPGAHPPGSAARPEKPLPQKESRRNERKRCSIPAMVSTSETAFDVLINNISKGGIFFKTHQQLSQGQTLDLMIPLRNKGKLLKRSGTVIWCRDEGVGVQLGSGGKKRQR